MEEKKKKLLVIDDAPELCNLLKLILEDAGFEVSVLQEPHKTMELLKNSEKPYLIILDVVMPEMSGWDVCDLIRSDPETCNIPIMFLTVNADSKYVEKGFSIGANSYMSKPFKPVELIERVKRITDKPL